MGNCLAPQPGEVKQRRGAAAARLKAWRATGIVTLPPGAKEVRRRGSQPTSHRTPFS